MKRITTSVSTFRDMIEGGFLYVDKTECLWQLVEPAKGICFLSRPRRFGKSLTLSTFEEIFLGTRELFQGLAIYDKPFEWKEHPIIRIDLGSRQAKSGEELDRLLSYAVQDAAARYDFELTREGCAAQFEELVNALAKRERVVILIDEYDKPILGNIEDTAQVTEIRDVLKAFYSVIKTTDRHLRFAFLTGVSKFSRVSVFSDLNNLDDLTMNARVATLCGYTQEELEANFAEHLQQLAEELGCPLPEALGNVREWYNGYRFSKADTSVYNPVSIGRLLSTGHFSNYWFETGTPSFLIKLLQKEQYDLEGLPGRTLSETAFSTYDVERIDVLPLLVQTGYLTIREVETRNLRTYYRLGFPNREVEDAFSTWLAAAYSNISRGDVEGALFDIIDSLNAGDLDTCFRHLRALFAKIPNNIQLEHEKYYQTIFFTIFTLLGREIDAEVSTNIGRIDAVAKTDSTIYIFEFKLQGTAEEALEQIRERRYYERYLADGRDILLVGAAFDPGVRNLERWVTSSVTD